MRPTIPSQNTSPKYLENVNVSDIGEQGLLQKLHQFCPTHLIGNDAALLEVTPGYQLVVTTDVLVDGVHFSLGRASPGVVTTSPADVGWRSTAANLSDLAAMGADPIAITVGLSLPGDIPVQQVEELYTGIVECLNPFGAVIAGGDVCRSSVISVAIAAFGQVMPGKAILRTTARPGDVIVATGIHGASRAGLELLLHPTRGDGLSKGDRSRLIQAHQRPRPRLDVVTVLRDLNIFQTSHPIAGMDSSDGLADAVVQLCKNSGVGAQLERRNLPMPECFSSWLSPEQTMNWVLYGGEDFELILCLPEDAGRSLVAELGDGAAIIGSVTTESDILLMDSRKEYPEIPLKQTQGFQHF